jgi:SAM-dependent methyltransferase
MTADFSAWAELYARARPNYPAALFEYLAGLCPRREVAWDCATGNGQAALGLADHFARVVATDRSLEQIRQAGRHPRVAYRVAAAERSALPDGSADLVTVAAALHWFDLDAFYREATRVLARGGVLAAWSYHAGHLDPPFGELLWAYYRDVVRPFFPPGFEYVDDRYAGIHLPGSVIEAPTFWIEVDWTCDQLLDFVRSWSGTQAYLKRHGRDPSEALRRPLSDLFGDAGGERRLRWPLYLRVSRV